MSGTTAASDPIIRSTLAYYDEHAEEFVRRTRDVDMHAARDAFTAMLSPGARILDAGCGSGRDTAAFVSQGFQVLAFDGSAALAKLASAYTGVSVMHLTFDQLAFDAAFDGVWACASLLHVPRNRLDKVIDRLAAAMKPGGILFMSLKTGEGDTIEEGRLTTLVSERDAYELVERNPRLSLVREWTTLDAQGRPIVWVNVLARRLAPGVHPG